MLTDVADALDMKVGAPVPRVAIPRAFLRAVGLRLADIPPTGYVARVWDGAEWASQTLAGFLATGTMPGGAGAPCVSASAGRQWDTDLAQDVWASRDLALLLGSSSFRGPVFALIATTGEVVDVMPYPPGGVLFAVLEGVHGSLREWYARPTPLLESWAASLVVSRFPWPQEPGSAVEVPAVEGRVLRHFWSAVGDLRSDGVVTDRTLLGWATAWSPLLGDAVSRASRTARALGVEGLQWRVGAHRDLLGTFADYLNVGTLQRPGDTPHHRPEGPAGV